MFERLQTFFQTLAQQRESNALAPDDPRITVAALCFQIMEADGLIHDRERSKLEEILTEKYALDRPSLQKLMVAGQAAENEAVDYYRFTADLKRQLDTEQRLNLVGILWDIVYADGDRSEMEDHAIWRVAELLGISQRDSVHLRQEAAERAGLDATQDD